MGVARRGLDLPVAQQLPDHREGLPQRQGAAGVGMSQIVDPDVFQARLLADDSPDVIEAAQAPARLPAGYDPRVAGQARQPGEKLHRRRRERDRPRARLRVVKP